MVEASILHYKAFNCSKEPIFFDFFLEDKNRTLKGKLEFDFQKEEIRAELNVKLSYTEKIAILIEIFNKFYLSSSELYNVAIDINLDKFKFVDLKNEREPKTFLQELMEIDRNIIGAKREKYRLLFYILQSCKQLDCDAKMNVKNIRLYPITVYNELECKVCHFFISEYLKFKNYNYTLRILSANSSNVTGNLNNDNILYRTLVLTAQSS